MSRINLSSLILCLFILGVWSLNQPTPVTVPYSGTSVFALIKEVGQPDFSTTSPDPPSYDADQVSDPTGVWPVSDGVLVSDGTARVLYFANPIITAGASAVSVLGQASTSGNDEYLGSTQSVVTLNGSSETWILSSDRFYRYDDYHTTTRIPIAQYGYESSATFLPLAAAETLAFDSAGYLYVADAGNGRVLKYDTVALKQNLTQNPIAVWGRGDYLTGAGTDCQSNTPYTCLDYPTSIAIDCHGGAWIVDDNGEGSNSVLLYFPAGSTTATAAWQGDSNIGLGKDAFLDVNQVTISPDCKYVVLSASVYVYVFSVTFGSPPTITKAITLGGVDYNYDGPIAPNNKTDCTGNVVGAVFDPYNYPNLWFVDAQVDRANYVNPFATPLSVLNPDGSVYTGGNGGGGGAAGLTSWVSLL